MFFSSQFWGLGLPVAIIIELVLLTIDLSIIVEALIYMDGVEEGHPQEDAFSILNFVIGPLRRFFVDAFALTPMVFLSFVMLYFFVMTWIIIYDHYILLNDDLILQWVSI